MEEIDIRSWENPIIEESYDWTLKLGEELKEIVLAGGWATYLQAKGLGLKALPSLDIDFVALKSNFKHIEEYLLRNNFTPVSFRYIKYYLETQEGELEEINLDESKKHLSHELKEIYLDMIWDQKVSTMSFVHPYVKTIFDEHLYDKIKGISVAIPEVILSMKFLIDENKHRGQKQIKDLVDIYTLIDT